MRRDPYRVLGVPPTASAEELHDAYRRLIKLHHPDRNGGSAESTARFQEIQAAYEELKGRPRAASAARASDESVEERMAKLEGEVRAAQAEREKAREKARQALRDLEPEPEPEPVEEEDSICAILFDIIDEIGERITGPRRDPARDVNDLMTGWTTSLAPGPGSERVSSRATRACASTRPRGPCEARNWMISAVATPPATNGSAAAIASISSRSSPRARITPPVRGI